MDWRSTMEWETEDDDEGDEGCGETTSPPASTAPCAFPCLEQPCRTVFRMGGDRFLWSDKHGKVKTVVRRSQPADPDEFVLLSYKRGAWKIKSHKYQRFLQVMDRVEKDGSTKHVVCTAEEMEQIRLVEVDGDNNEEADLRALWGFHREFGTGRVMITSLFNGETLVCDEVSGAIALAPLSADSPGACWNLHTVSGELGFLSCPTIDRRLRCDIIGVLNMTDNWKGWEVWRFMESTNNHVCISSWMHSQFLLACRLVVDEETTTKQYKIIACTLAQSYKEEAVIDTEWAICKAQDGSEGIWLRSKKFGQLLCVTLDGQMMARSEDDDNPGFLSSCLWQMEAAHLQKYTLACSATGSAAAPTKKGAMVSVGPFPFVTSNLKQTDEWIMEHREVGVVAFSRASSTMTKEYLCVNSANNVVLEKEPSFDGADLWVMEAAPGAAGSYTFQSKWQGSFLAYQDGNETSGTLVCIALDRTDDDEINTPHMHYNYIWQMSPCMPRAVSSSKIKTFAIGTSIAVGTTVAMPFAIMGVMGMLGAVAEVGMLAEIITIGLTGAEALASVGVVGATAAIIFRESSDSLGGTDDATTQDDNARNSISKRPFCAWRTW